MATKPCKDCGHLVGESAITCPQCGGFVSGNSTMKPAASRQIVGIEKTSKGLKLWASIGQIFLVAFIGVVVFAFMLGNKEWKLIGLIGCAASVLLCAIVQIQIWWRHG